MKKSLLDHIGNTPLIEIKKLNPNPNVKIFAKLEYFNPGGSIKDRAAMYMIDDGEKAGKLTHKKIVLEATSGNTGIGLALVCSIKGYKMLFAMSESASIERQKILKARGSEILLTPGHLGTDGAIEEVYRLAREYPDTYFMTDQYNNEANWKAHYYGTAEEIWAQTNGTVSMIIATMGTTGTIMGLSRRFKEYNPDIKIIGVEPYLGHKIQGLKNMKEAYCPGLYNKKYLDEKINIEDENAFEMTRRLAKEEGIFVGMSSGAAMFIAAKQAEQLDSGVIVTIFPDSGERYLSTTLFTEKTKAEIKIQNTLTRNKEPFHPIIPGKVSVYSCGPTAHARMNPGECRRIVFSDILCRYLEYRGYSVNQIMNITDVDDKTILGSEKEGLSLSEFTEKNIETFKKDLALLNIKQASKYPKTSEHIDAMVSLAEKLFEKGFAYEKLHSLYFNISKFQEYGKLSGIDLNKIKSGLTIDLDEYEKDNPKDFTLLKRSKLSELKRGIYTKTKWGNVRASWHIQCVAMSMQYLGETFDIHTSARKLIFPHNENEIAIAKAVTGKPLAKYWMHCDSVLIPDENQNITLDDLIQKGYSAKTIRYWLLSTHYSKSMTFSLDRIESSQNALERINTCIKRLKSIKTTASNFSELNQLIYDIKQGFILSMDDDLNISGALASTFKSIKTINALITKQKLSCNDADKLIDCFKSIDSVLNVFSFEEEISDNKTLELIKQRNKARANKNWELADKIKDELTLLGIKIHDKKTSE
ncbi:MAG: cysteine--tRNA ligase [Desulfobacterales bacterium]|nr:cysteine--tRNA ligase [Desulfobacterales bacterium]